MATTRAGRAILDKEAVRALKSVMGRGSPNSSLPGRTVFNRCETQFLLGGGRGQMG